MSELRTLYPEVEPFDAGRLKVSPVQELYGHELYYEECGNPQGKPVIFLHGGPGAKHVSNMCAYPDQFHYSGFDINHGRVFLSAAVRGCSIVACSQPFVATL